MKLFAALCSLASPLISRSNATSHDEELRRLSVSTNRCPCSVFSAGDALACVCNHTDNHIASQKRPSTDQKRPRSSLRCTVDHLFVLPARTTHAPHWLEELAQFTNHLSSIEYNEYHTSIAAVVNQRFFSLGEFITANKTRYHELASKPISSFGNASWSDVVSSAITASLMRRYVDSTFLINEHMKFDRFESTRRPRLSVADTLSPSCQHVFGNSTYIRHATLEEFPLVPGRQWFGSKQSCELFQEAVSSLWQNGEGHQRSENSTDYQSLLALRCIVVVNRSPDVEPVRYISNEIGLVAALKSSYPDCEVISFVPGAESSVSQQLRTFGAADVVISVHGAALYAIPVMRKGSLVIEAFSGSALGLCRSYFYGLGSFCGIEHRVYNEGAGHRHAIFPTKIGGRCAGSVAVDVGVVRSMIESWLQGVVEPEESKINDYGLLRRWKNSERIACSVPDVRQSSESDKRRRKRAPSKYEYLHQLHCPLS